MARRVFWLGVAVVAAIALYTAGWFYAADRLASELRSTLAEIGRDGGNRAVCEEPDIRGYPFRIGVFCNATYVERASAGFSMSTGAFRSAAHIYAPRQAIAEADSPARLLLPGLVPLDLTWGGLRASARLAWPLPERLSVEATRLSAIADMPNVSGPLAFTAERAEVHLRPDGADLDVALRFSDFEPGQLLLRQGTLPPLSGLADIAVRNGVELLRSGANDLRGTSFEIRKVEVRTREATLLTVAGTASVDNGGLLDADLILETSDAAALARAVTTAFPEEGPSLASAITALSALGPNPRLPLAIRKGQARLGFIDLGMVPPL